MSFHSHLYPSFGTHADAHVHSCSLSLFLLPGDSVADNDEMSSDSTPINNRDVVYHSCNTSAISS
jgi:hypothetical protein